MAFLDMPVFPDEIAAWAIGGRGFKTTVVETYGGWEYRNQAWQYARGEWSITDALRSGKVASAYAVQLLRNLQRESRGMAGGFRFRNYAEIDYQDEGQGTVAQIGVTNTYQMYKAYPTNPAGTTYSQIVNKPRNDGHLAIQGGGSYTVDYTTGIITKTGGAAPTGWTGNFDIACRFNMDVPRFGLTDEGALYNWQDLKIIEIRV